MRSDEPLHGHWSHDIVEVEPHLTSTHQFPVRADHENLVYFNSDKTQAIVRCHNGNGGPSQGAALHVGFVTAGGNKILNPPRLTLDFVGEQPSQTRLGAVSIESLLYAIKTMQDADALRRGPQAAD